MSFQLKNKFYNINKILKVNELLFFFIIEIFFKNNEYLIMV